MAGIVYATVFCPWHAIADPEIVPASTGNVDSVIAKFAEKAPLPQLLTPRTAKFPDEALLAKVIDILFVVPLVIVTPEPE